MPHYRYTASSPEGGIRKGVVEAKSKAQAVSSLQERGLMLMDLIEERQRPPAAESRESSTPKLEPPPKAPPLPTPISPLPTRQATWSRTDRAVFLRQLAIMFTAGVSLFKALDVLSTQGRRPALNEALRQMVKGLESGVTFSVIMERSRLFSPLQIGTVKIGEATGRLSHLLVSLADLEEQEVTFRRKLVARLSYPLGVLLAVIVGLALLGHVMGGALTTLVTSLPGSESVRFLLLLGQILASPWFLVLALAIPLAGVAILRALLRRESSRAALESVLLRVSPFGPLWRRMQAAQLCRLLAVMISSGVRADKTLELVRLTSESPAARQALRTCSDSLKDGSGLAPAMRRSQFFPPEVVHMAAAGEECGQLSAMLERVSEYCEVEVERFLESACAALEPVAMAALGAGVGVVILVTFAPIYQILDKL